MKMSNDKVQMPNQTQSSNAKAALKHLNFDIPLVLGF
jgi:hypothetical protein